MHLLWLKTEFLHPVDKGGRIRTYQMLRALRRRHRVTYVTLDDGRAAPDALERAKEYATDVLRIPFRTSPRRSARFYLELAANALSPLPYAVAKYRSAAMRRAIAHAVRDGSVDVIVCDFLAPAINLPSELPVPLVLFEHNVEALIWRRHADVARRSLVRAYFGAQWRRMWRFERDTCRRADHVVAVSDADLRLLRDDYGVSAGSAVATGVDVDFFTPTPGASRHPRSIVFTGSMDWMPNEDAMLYFSDAIWPQIRAAAPDATLTIVGRQPGARIEALAARDPAIRVTGTVPDVRPYLEEGAVFVIPLRVGGGTRLKVYEAMAMQIPVVSTTVGTEGLPVTNGEHVVLADDPGRFAAAVVELLNDPSRASRMARAAAGFVREKFSWQRVAEDFAAICESVSSRRDSSAVLQTS